MCRWAAYIGKPVFLSAIVSDPGHSLIEQSRGADKAKTAINADGFGVAWYDRRPNPGLYKDILPAWSDPNLLSLCDQVQSGVFMAHVRASTGTATARVNCHPFTYENWSFMHNGQVGGFEQIRKWADMKIPDALYSNRTGSTDSEAIFLHAIAEGLDRDPIAAVYRAITAIEAHAPERPHMRFTAALSDGAKIYAFRYASDSYAPSLFYRWSESRNGWAIVSEPLETGQAGWSAVRAGTCCVFDQKTVTCHALA